MARASASPGAGRQASGASAKGNGTGAAVRAVSAVCMDALCPWWRDGAALRRGSGGCRTRRQRSKRAGREVPENVPGHPLLFRPGPYKGADRFSALVGLSSVAPLSRGKVSRR
ncbi:hypothetical protein SSP35_05_01420 [Streptomyces sp. NBRC 110611]|nr:hypothetical protein SSP35_05_01420 [Streptomyces sp. NBRC 110611]